MNFFKEYIRNVSSVGAIAPSSRFLSKKMTSFIGSNKPINILEVGAGTGVFTKSLIKNTHPDGSLYVSELNPYFCDILSKKFGEKINLIPGDILNYHVDSQFDYIICSIPFNSIPIEATDAIFQHFKKIIKPGGNCVFFEYGLLPYFKPQNKFISYKKEHLVPNRIKRDFTLINLPPAFIHHIKL